MRLHSSRIGGFPRALRLSHSRASWPTFARWRRDSASASWSKAPGTGNIEAYEYFFRGRSYYNRQGQKNIRKAIEMFERAIALDPDIADGHTARIMVAGAKSQYAEADAAFSKAVEIDPKNFEAYYQYGRHKVKRGDLQHALAMFERAHAIDPYDFQTPILVMGILRSQDERKALAAAREGVRAAQVHLEQHPDNARAYVLAAGALQYLGEHDKAKRFVETALRIGPESQDTQYNAACFFARAGEADKALDCLERGMHDPDWIENDSDLDAIRDHPRYRQLIEQRGATMK